MSSTLPTIRSPAPIANRVSVDGRRQRHDLLGLAWAGRRRSPSSSREGQRERRGGHRGRARLGGRRRRPERSPRWRPAGSAPGWRSPRPSRRRGRAHDGDEPRAARRRVGTRGSAAIRGRARARREPLASRSEEGSQPGSHRACPFSRRFEHRPRGRRPDFTPSGTSVTVAGLCRDLTGFATQRSGVMRLTSGMYHGRPPAGRPTTDGSGPDKPQVSGHGDTDRLARHQLHPAGGGHVSEACSGHRRWGAMVPPLLGLPRSSSPRSRRSRPGRSRRATRRSRTRTRPPSNPPCMGWDDPHPERMLTLADERIGRPRLRRATATRAAPSPGPTSLGRTPSDWGYYVHSHGDYYLDPDGQRRYTGFREDSGDCVQSVVYSKDIKAKRAGRAEQPRRSSRPASSANANTTMPDAFAIAKTKAKELTGTGPEFYRRLPRRPRGTTTSGRSSSGSGTRSREGKSVGAVVRHRDARRLQRPELRRRLVGQLPLVGTGWAGGTCPTCV